MVKSFLCFSISFLLLFYNWFYYVLFSQYTGLVLSTSSWSPGDGFRRYKLVDNVDDRYELTILALDSQSSPSLPFVWHIILYILLVSLPIQIGFWRWCLLIVAWFSSTPFSIIFVVSLTYVKNDFVVCLFFITSSGRPDRALQFILHLHHILLCFAMLFHSMLS